MITIITNVHLPLRWPNTNSFDLLSVLLALSSSNLAFFASGVSFRLLVASDCALLFFFALPPAPPKVICNVSIDFHWVYSRYILDFRNQTWSEPYYIMYLEEWDCKFADGFQYFFISLSHPLFNGSRWNW